MVDSASLAVLVSLFALLISAISLGWNIYRDVALKARLQLSIAKVELVQAPSKNYGKYISITVINFGPGDLTLEMLHLRVWKWNVQWIMNLRIWWLLGRFISSRVQAIITHDFTNPLSAQLPQTLKSGERANLLFKWDGKEHSFLSLRPTHVGISDSYGRFHWVPKSQLKSIVAEWHANFPDTTKLSQH